MNQQGTKGNTGELTLEANQDPPKKKLGGEKFVHDKGNRNQQTGRLK